MQCNVMETSLIPKCLSRFKDLTSSEEYAIYALCFYLLNSFFTIFLLCAFQVKYLVKWKATDDEYEIATILAY